jgi:cation diffusion facilitator CzcD-associated flavoprotein CzcO
VVILGAGMSGLCAAVKLKRAGQHRFIILEKADGLGGTWWDNTYPGAHVDVPAPVYSFSFAPNADWSRRFASAPEIQTYMRRLAARHGLLGHLRLGSQVNAATFDASTGHWHIDADNAQGVRTTHRARFFVCSTGPLSQPRWPDLPGIADFQGQRLHSARWDHRYAMAGKRVAVIGTGSTASQLVPPIAAEAQHLHVFQRTANWVLPRLDRRYFGVDRLLASMPPYAAAVRWCWMHTLELSRRGFDEGTFMRRVLLGAAGWHSKKQVPDDALRARLAPTYPLGCKRIIYSNDYLRAFMQPNVELVTDAISRVTAHGIVTADGRERPIDALVCATGFEVAESMASIRVTGLQGHTLSERWQRGPEAYHGITVAGFPNMFLMLGPNTATGHTSTLLYIEPQADHAIACMHAVRKGGHRYIDVKAGVLREHNDALQKRLGASVWAQCRSWYRMDNGKVFALFPGFTKEYVAAVRTPDFSAYAFDVEFDVALADSFADASLHAPATSPADTPARSLSANAAPAQTAPAQTAAAHSAARPSSLIAAPDARDAVVASAPASAAADATVTAKAAV